MEGGHMTEETKLILGEIQELKQSVQDIRMTLENETNRNIKIIAEGHLDLNRKLDEALKSENEKEMQEYIIKSSKTKSPG